MRIVFLGSGSFAIPSFEALIASGHDVAALVTQPDREKGRGRALAPPPLKPVAQARHIPVLQPPRVRDPQALSALRALAPELQVVVAYGQILPQGVIEIPPRGTVNVHGSLLPRYRGAAPIAWAIAGGETETGVTTMLIDEGLDTGPLLLARSTPIGPEETAAELEPRLARLGADLLLETVRGLGEGLLQPKPQDHSLASYAPLLKKEDGRIDWNVPADVLARRVRGFNPWPGTHTLWQGRALKVLRARPAPGGPGEPGAVVSVDREGLVVACGPGTRLELLEVQLEGRRPVGALAFSSGARLHPGARFG
jgi:methionyl-tRNA formyltransferase